MVKLPMNESEIRLCMEYIRGVISLPEMEEKNVLHLQTLNNITQRDILRSEINYPWIEIENPLYLIYRIDNSVGMSLLSTKNSTSMDRLKLLKGIVIFTVPDALILPPIPLTFLLFTLRVSVINRKSSKYAKYCRLYITEVRLAQVSERRTSKVPL